MEKFESINLEVNTEKSKVYEIGSGYNYIQIPAQDRLDNIKLGYMKALDDDNYKPINGLQVHLINSAGVEYTLPYNEQEKPISQNISKFNYFYFSYKKIDNNINFKVFLFDKLLDDSIFSVSVKKDGKHVFANREILASDIYEAYRMGVISIKATGFTQPSILLAKDYNIKLITVLG